MTHTTYSDIYPHRAAPCRHTFSDPAAIHCGTFVYSPPSKTSRPHSYAKRYELLLRRLVQERQYSGTCLLMSEASRAGASNNYTEPASDLSVASFFDGLLRRCAPRS